MEYNMKYMFKNDRKGAVNDVSNYARKSRGYSS